MSAPNVVHIYGAGMLDEIFEITLKTGEFIVWNITKLNAAAQAGAFGPPRYLSTGDLPPACWETWGPEDRATVDYIKTDRAVLDAPAICIALENPDYLASCIADGQHRITARQELGLRECAFYLVPLDMERAFRVTGFEAIR